MQKNAQRGHKGKKGKFWHTSGRLLAIVREKTSILQGRCRKNQEWLEKITKEQIMPNSLSDSHISGGGWGQRWPNGTQNGPQINIKVLKKRVRKSIAPKVTKKSRLQPNLG